MIGRIALGSGIILALLIALTAWPADVPATGLGQSQNGNSGSSDLTQLTTTDANDPPAFSGPATRTVAENSAASTLVGLPVAATDTDDTSLTYTIEGESADAFTIDANGQLRVAEGAVLDHESNPTIVVTVKAADSSEATDSTEVTVTVTDVWDPNVVLIIADDVGYELFGAHGSKQYRTPNIDAISAAGVRFNNAHANPCCDGSKLEVMTGKSNVRNYAGPDVLAPSEYTFMDLFQDSIYTTGAAGKWGFNGGTPDQITQPSDKFDEFCMWNTSLTEQVAGLSDPSSRYWEPRISCNGEIRDVESDDFGPDIFASFLLDFIDDNQNRPFFAYYPMVLAHKPFVATPGDTVIDSDTPAQFKFEAMVKYMDRNVGLVHDQLSDLGLLDNTVLIFTSDNTTPPQIISALNGTYIGGEKSLTLDRGTHVTLIVHVPGYEGTRVLNDLVSLTDVLPTLADATGLSVPDDNQLDGVSFWERLKGNSGQPREWIYTYYFPQPYAASFNHPRAHPPTAWVRDQRYKLYHTGELFDVVADPLETRPLAADDTTTSTRRTLLQEALDSMPSRGQAIDWTKVGETSNYERPRWRPAFSSAVVDGTQLTLNYVGGITQWLSPATGSYTVRVDGSEREVARVRVNTDAVALTLASAVTAGQTVTVSYRRGWNAIRKITDANIYKAASFTSAPVRNETEANSPPTGFPTISGAPQVGETLTADASSIADEDGLDNTTFSYQWIRNDGTTDTDISGATGPTYPLVANDRGKTLKVRMNFTDDAGNEETLTSPPFDPSVPYGLTAAVSGSTVVLTWEAPVRFPNLYGYRIIRGRPALGETEPSVYIDTRNSETSYTDTDVEPGALYVYRVQAATFSWFSAASEPVEMRTPVSTMDENTPATGAPAVSGMVQVGETLEADTSGIADADGLKQATFSYQWLRNDGTTDFDIGGATDSTYTLVDADKGKTIKVRVSFTDDAGNEESLTSAATAAVVTPLTASVHDAPASHDGSSAFTFELRFSEEPIISYKTLRDHAFTVSGGDVSGARRLEKDRNVRWEVRVEPSGNETITITLPATTDCDADGAICMHGNDGRMLSGAVVLKVPGPNDAPSTSNTPATGAPAITGTARVGETLTASTSGIADADGLTNATFSYQWLRNDGTTDTTISGATSSSYTLVDADKGKTIKVRVSFTDDASNEESLTSVVTGAVAARSLSLDDFDVGDGHEALASALVLVGDRGRKNNGSQDRAWYATDTSDWHASGKLRDGSLAWDDMTLTRVLYIPDAGELRFNESDSVHIGESFAAGGVNRELTVWIQTETDTVSFLAKEHILNSGSGWINFNPPAVVRAVLAGVSKDDLVIIAVSAPANS